MSGSFFDKLLASRGEDATDFRANSKIGRVLRKRGVRNSSTIKRVLNIPRRSIDPESAEAVELLTGVFGHGSQKLRPLQAVALCELHDYGGLFAPLAVGSGKTIVSMLASVALGARRPVLLVPAKLRDKTFHEIHEIRRHWKVPYLRRAETMLKHPGNGELALLSYEMLGRESGAEILERIKPDLLVADEAHRLKNAKAAVTKRVRRYVTTHRPRVAFMSGTIASRSILDFAHLLEWAFPDMNPTPETYPERQEWSWALDTKVDPAVRLAPGALEAFWNEEESKMLDTTAATRSAFRRRLVETPGVVATSENDIGVSLAVETVDVWGKDKALDAIFKTLRSSWELPDGQPIPDPPSFRRHAIELSLGFWYRWVEQPPKEWLKARSEWCTFARETLSTNRRNYDSEGQIASACQRGEYDTSAWEAWEAIRGTFTPVTEAVWVSERVLEYCAAWAKDTKGPIIWANQIKFGEKLAEVTGFPYYGAKATNKLTKKTILEHTPRGTPIIASVKSVSEGQNLQDAWSNNLITDCDPQGRVFEQLVGRTHRPGQEEDEVGVVWLTGCREAFAGFRQAREDARFIEQTTGARQKLCYADVTEGAIHGGPRWD